MTTESITSPNDAAAALLNWQESGEEIFKRFVQNQMELCHFFDHRWEQNLRLPEQLTQCRSEQLTDSVTKTTDAWMGAMPASPMDADFKNVKDRAMNMAMENSESVFTFAGKISKAHTFPDLARLQTLFVQDRMQTFATQTQELYKLMGEWATVAL